MRVYLASTYNGLKKETREKLVREIKPKYILESFINGEKKCAAALHDVGRDCFLLDSGAYSYMNGQDTTLVDMEAYVERYVAFIKKNRVRYYFEMDVDNIFGLEQVEAWRKEIEAQTGIRCIPVWHKGRGIEYFKRLCDEYAYIAIGGLVFHVRQCEYGIIRKMVDYAYARGVKVHGLGFTKTQELKNYKFYSVDSAAWSLSAALGQQIYVFKDRRMVSRKLNKQDKKVDLDRLIAHNMREWVKYQKYMDGIRW